MWFSRIRDLFTEMTMVDHGQNTVNLGHGQIVAHD